MKKLIYSAIALATASAFVACDDDTDDNPVLGKIAGTEGAFVLNTPSFATAPVDLSATEALSMTWNQPSWGFPMAASYVLQVSATGEYTTSFAAAAADESGTLKADYYDLDAVSSLSFAYSAKQVNRALASLCKWGSEADVPASADIFLRMLAMPTMTTADSSYFVYSNVVKLSSCPAYVALKDAPPALWFLIGEGATGDWTNSADGIGTGLFPMGIIAGAKYDSNTGTGTIAYSGYIPAGKNFKLVMNPSSWNFQIGSMGDSYGVFDGTADLTVAESGYYTIFLNTAAKGMPAMKEGHAANLAEDLKKKATAFEDPQTLVIEPMAEAPAYYGATGINIVGLAGDWDAGIPMEKIQTTADFDGNEHLWRATIDVAEGDEFKLREGPTWDGAQWSGINADLTGCYYPNVNDPSVLNYYHFGLATKGGNNSAIPAGKYLLLFNDIDASYALIPLK